MSRTRRGVRLALGGLLAAVLTACSLPVRPAPTASGPPAESAASEGLRPMTLQPTLPPITLPRESATPTGTPTARPTATATPSPSATATVSPSPTPTRCGESAGRVLTGNYPSPTQGWSPPYRIYLPPCYGLEDRLYPALYMFHGNIYSERHWDDIGIDEAADAGIAAGALPPFVIVMPFGGDIANNSSGGNRSFEGVVLNDLMPYIEDQYCVWAEPAGRAIGGLSRGGYWSLEIAFRRPELFAAVGGHSPAIFPDNAGPEYNPLMTGADPRLVGLPIYMDIGDQDWLRQGAFDLHGIMSAAGVPHEWLVHPGAHGDAYWAEHVGEYLAWYGSHWPASPAGYPSAAGRACSR